MKKILGLAFAGAMLIACGSSNKSSTGMQNTTAATTETPPATTTTPTPPSDNTNPTNPSPSP